MVSLTVTPRAARSSHASFRLGNRLVPQPFFLALLLTLAAIAADQFAAPALYSSSPLGATAACLLLVWRRGYKSDSSLDFSVVSRGTRFSLPRIAMFCGAHAALVLAALATQGALQPVAGTSTAGGWVVAALKLLTLAPTFLLLPPAEWRTIWHAYKAEATAAIVKLFDYLFAFVAFLDWNRLRKGRALLAYFAGIAVILLGNALRITSMVVLGNHGFANFVARFHLSAGWIFFTLVFLAYLALIYRSLLSSAVAEPPSNSGACTGQRGRSG